MRPCAQSHAHPQDDESEDEEDSDDGDKDSGDEQVINRTVVFALEDADTVLCLFMPHN